MIQLICNFDDPLFTSPACEIQEVEDVRLRDLDQQMQEKYTSMYKTKM
jgi:hypothetical protein